MKRLLLIFIFIPLLSGTFVLKNTYETKIDELEQRIIALENQDTLLNETFIEQSEHYELTVVIEEGYIQYIITTDLETNESEKEYPNENEQTEPLTSDDKEMLIEEMKNYLEQLIFHLF